VYEQLRALAASYLGRDSADLILEPSVLVNEAYLRLVAAPPGSWQNASHFFAVAASAMRRILIDHARRRRTLKRGYGHAKVAFEVITSTGSHAIDIREVDDALTALARVNGRAATIVELRFFAGLTHDQVARVLGVSRKTVVEDWAEARDWLARNLFDRG
jgi:RNA polymerase sigma factor (TIGR02999 family)